MRRRPPRWLAVVGPAWLVMLADVDAPSVLTAGQAGTAYGTALLFPIVALIPVLYLVQEMTARLGIVTGRGHAELIRERFGRRWAVVAVVSMAAIDLIAYVGEFAGIALGAAIVGVPVGIAVGGTLAVHSVIVLTGSYRRFERLALALSFTLFVFVALALVHHPPPGEIVRGLSPLPPFGPPGSFGLAVALVGASVMPWMLFYQQSATVDKGLSIDDLGTARRETMVGAVVSQGLMAAIVIAAAAVAIVPAGTPAPDGAGLPMGLANLASGPAGPAIAVGLVGSGLLALIVVSLASAWAWCEYAGWPHSLDQSPRRAPGFFAMYLFEVVPAALIALVAPDLGVLVIRAMILNVVVLAIPLTFLVRLSSDRTLLGPLASSRARTALLWVVTGGVLAIGLVAIIESFGSG